jgi:hypothetical protein
MAGGRADALEKPRTAAEQPLPAVEAPTGTVWRRVALAPGVELHYQPSGDRRRDAAIARLIRAAAGLLADSPRDEPRSRLGFSAEQAAADGIVDEVLVWAAEARR